jgi:hypothetical protein
MPLQRGANCWAKARPIPADAPVIKAISVRDCALILFPFYLSIGSIVPQRILAAKPQADYRQTTVIFICRSAQLWAKLFESINRSEGIMSARLCSLINTELAIVQAPMAGVQGSKLAISTLRNVERRHTTR